MNRLLIPVLLSLVLAMQFVHAWLTTRLPIEAAAVMELRLAIDRDITLHTRNQSETRLSEHPGHALAPMVRTHLYPPPHRQMQGANELQRLLDAIR